MVDRKPNDEVFADIRRALEIQAKMIAEFVNAPLEALKASASPYARFMEVNAAMVKIATESLNAPFGQLQKTMDLIARFPVVEAPKVSMNFLDRIKLG